MSVRLSILSATGLTVALLLLGVGHPNRAAADTAQVVLTVKDGVACTTGTADFCVFPSATFTLSVDITKAPALGYWELQTEIDYGSLIYKPTALAGDEIVWPDSARPLRSPAFPTGLEGLVNHSDSVPIGSINRWSNFEGNILELTMNCTADDSTGNVITLVPRDGSNTDGSVLIQLTEGPPILTPLSDTITVDCALPSEITPPPAATPTPPSVGGVSFQPPLIGPGASGALDTTAALALIGGAVALTSAVRYVRRRPR